MCLGGPLKHEVGLFKGKGLSIFGQSKTQARQFWDGQKNRMSLKASMDGLNYQ